MSNTLHIVSRLHGPALPPALVRCLADDDGLLLTGDGVHAAFSDRAALPASCWALAADVQARGLAARWPADIALVDHAGFVALCVRYDKSLSWA